MDIIKAENIGVSFKFSRKRTGNLQDFLAGLFNQKKDNNEKFWALKRVSFTIQKGETLGIIGRNGSGKTTLLRVIGGMYTPDEGRIEVRANMSSLLSPSAGFQPELSGAENIFLNGILLGLKKNEIDRVFNDIVEFSELGKFIEMPIKTYSSGMSARLAFSIAVNIKGDILLMDEILGAGDSKFSEKARKKMEKILSEGRTIVFASHNMNTIKKFAENVIWLDKGEVVDEGHPKDIVPKYLHS